MRLVPVVPDTHFHQQRNIQLGRGAHVHADVFADLLDQIFTHLQHQFIVNLQDDASIQT